MSPMNVCLIIRELMHVVGQGGGAHSVTTCNDCNLTSQRCGGWLFQSQS